MCFRASDQVPRGRRRSRPDDGERLERLLHAQRIEIVEHQRVVVFVVVREDHLDRAPPRGGPPSARTPELRGAPPLRRLARRTAARGRRPRRLPRRAPRPGPGLGAGEGLDGGGRGVLPGTRLAADPSRPGNGRPKSSPSYRRPRPGPGAADRLRRRGRGSESETVALLRRGWPRRTCGPCLPARTKRSCRLCLACLASISDWDSYTAIETSGSC